MVHVYHQSSDSDLFWREETHVDWVELSVLDGLEMSRKKNKIVFEAYFDIEQEKWLLRWSFVKVLVNFEQAVTFCSFRKGIIDSDHHILVKRIYFDLYFFMGLNKQLHLKDGLQIEDIKHL